jgi:uncharacterized RmlC-like cupin family protein
MDDFAKRILRDWNLEEIAPRMKDRLPVDHWSPAVLLERAAYLRKMAKYGNGSASDIITDFPHYSVVLSFQGRTGDAVLNENHTCIIHVLSGTATLKTGGALTRPISAAMGELRADSIENGSPQELRQGDIVHIPTGIPYQFLITAEKAITCLMVKILEVK